MENSKTYQYRKVMKPMLERKRRARINKCLDDLKDLMVECLTHEGEHIVRLEKADILELTVDYLKKIKERKTKLAVPEGCPESFRNGYIHAANEVSKVLASTRGVDIRLGTTLMTHLGYKLNQIQSLETEGTLPSPSMSTSVAVAQVNPAAHIMTPLKIELDNYNSWEYPLSPASSGYHSGLESPVASDDGFRFSTTSKSKESVAPVWRPW